MSQERNRPTLASASGPPAELMAAPTQAAAAAPGAPALERLDLRGKFFGRGAEKFYLRGVTYGPFRPGPDGVPFAQGQAEEDLARMAAAGVNAIRVYTPPPGWLLDAAAAHGLVVMAGLAWEQHVAFLEDRRRADAIVERVTAEAAAVAGHPALFAWAVGNEIPAPVVRYSGARRIELFLERLTGAVRAVDPAALVTYVNYPTTEYLELGFLDFACFNVFLEQPDRYDAYLQRLQNVAEDRPLVLTEIGLDSGTHGEEAQARAIDWQVRAAYAAGCAGAFVFSWTDEWHRGGHDIEDWHFGVTDRARRPKPALAALQSAFTAAPPPPPAEAPSVSVVVCTYNGERTLEETCAAVARLEYPDFEAVLVDDGSTDRSAEIARAHGFRVISTENQGLSAARNTGLQHARGDVVAYLDDDAAPDPHWLLHLARALDATDYVAMGGPNLAVPGDGPVADAVAAAPGNPTHVLLSDRDAEHIPGCNSAYRVDALRAVGGFDTRFRVAGDDVDVCWQLQEHGGRIGYAPAAMVWHHRRNTIGAYVRQQRGYGHAEALLERKWPERYSAGGHVTWRGRLYGHISARQAHSGPRRWRVYHGVWGTAPFQSLYAPAGGELNDVLLMPEAYLAIGFLALLVALGTLWAPLFFLAPLLIAAGGVLGVRAVTVAGRARFPTPRLSRRELLVRRALTVVLHLVQPLARLEGRVRHGLTPWRRRGPHGLALPKTRTFERWSEEWHAHDRWIRSFEDALIAHGGVVRRGGDFDGWDLEARGGTLAGARLWSVVEEHGDGRQLARVRCRPSWSATALLLAGLLLALCAGAAVSGAVAGAVVLGVLGAALALRTLVEGAAATAAVVRSLRDAPPPSETAG